jgi:single-strand DNA-binding protein
MNPQMNDYSLAIVVGRLTHDPELKYTNPGGIPFLRMSLAVNRQVKTDNGDSKKIVTVVDVSVWRRLAELCSQFLKKGRAVMVVGTLKQSRWTDSSGGSKTRIEVLADRVQFLGPREGMPMESPNGATAEVSAAEQGDPE